MKRSLVFLSILFGFCFVSFGDEVQGKVTSYGIFKVTEQREIEPAPQTPTGANQRLLAGPVLVTSTNRIPAKIGVQFGLWYEINNLPVHNGEVEVTAIVSLPTITKPDGTTSKEFKVVQKQVSKDGVLVSWSGYGFEDDFELVTGDWDIKIQFNGKTVCAQEFSVFKETSPAARPAPGSDK